MQNAILNGTKDMYIPALQHMLEQSRSDALVGDGVRASVLRPSASGCLKNVLSFVSKCHQLDVLRIVLQISCVYCNISMGRLLMYV